MSAPVKVKICGLREERGLQAAVDGGASYVGFVFFRRSPRFVENAVAAALAARIPPGVISVGLFVDPTDAELAAVLADVPLGMVQLHGEETPERVAHLKKQSGLPVMKAIGVATAADIQRGAAYSAAADMLLFDAKAPPGALRPGGNAVAFPWALARGYAGSLPWMLAGGLTPENVAAAVAAAGATFVDVSSGVETEPGLKSPAKIRAFLAAVAAK